MSVIPGNAAMLAFGSLSVPDTSMAKSWLVTPPITSLTMGMVPRGKTRRPMPKVGMSTVPEPVSWIVPAARSQRVISAVLPLMLKMASDAEIWLEIGSINCVICSTRIASGSEARVALRMPTRPLPVRVSAAPLVDPSTKTTALNRLVERADTSSSGVPSRSTSKSASATRARAR